MTSLLLLKSMLVANALSKTKKKKKKKKLLLKPKPISKLCKGGNLNSRCRICDEEDGEIPIFNNFLYPNITEDIHHFSGVRVENSDDLPKQICKNCFNLLNGCIMFREMCQKTNKKLIELSIKKELNVEHTVEFNNFPEYNDTDQQAESDSSYNIPSPNYSEECTEVRCTYCDKDFPDTASYSTHRAQCHKDELCTPKKKFLCDVCGKTSKSRANLLIHKNIHENIFPFKCDKCPYKGRSLDLLKTHKMSHLSEAELPYRCTQCPKATTTASNLARHMRGVHRSASEKRSNAYKCEICPYQGRTVDLLKVHKRSHLTEAERPYRCPHCPKATTSASNLSKHIRHVHSVNKTHKCNYCERAFSFQHDMKRHIKEIHLRQGTVECDICFKKFNTKKILRGHQYKIHKLKGERQGRIPAYLQAQLEEPCENSGDNNMNDNINNESDYIL